MSEDLIKNDDISRSNLIWQPNRRYYHKLMANAMISITDTSVAKFAMLDHCYQFFASSKSHSKSVNYFARHYQSVQAAKWYTHDSFIHRIINKVLRSGNIEYCSLLRFYITHLSDQLHQLKIQQQVDRTNGPQMTIVYRGLRQSKSHLETLSNAVGLVILTKGFMSTTRDKQVALWYAGAEHAQCSESQALLIELHVDLQAAHIIAADISHLSNFPEECEVLFDIGSEFLVESLVYDTSTAHWLCQLTTLPNKAKTSQLFQYRLPSEDRSIRMHSYSNEEREFERMIRRERRRKFDTPRNTQYYNQLWCQLPSVSWLACTPIDRTCILQQKALIHWQRTGDLVRFCSECERAWTLFRSSMNSIPITEKDMACFLNNFAYTCFNLGENERAIGLLEQALEIRQRLESSEHFIAQTARNLGLAHKNLGNYDQAWNALKLALDASEHVPPTSQWTTCMTLRNIGLYYYSRNDHVEAMKYLARAIETFEHCENFLIQYDRTKED